MKRNKHPKQPQSRLVDLGLLITQAKVNVNQREPQPASIRAKSSPGPRRPITSRSPSRKEDEDAERLSRKTGGPSRSVSPGPTCQTHGGATSPNGLRTPVLIPSRSGPQLRRAKSSLGLRPSATGVLPDDSPPLRASSQWTEDQTKDQAGKIQMWQNPAGCLIAQRSPKEKALDSDRLRIEKWGLSACPLLVGEENLCLLSLKDNQIRKVENLRSLVCLVYLDLSNNALDVISGLDQLGHLRVLMLSQNRITQISGLTHLTRLDVLDLSGNRIQRISCVNHLRSLRLLNLSRNNISVVEELLGLNSLVDLNLGFNEIASVELVDKLPCLQKLCFENNVVQRIEDMESVLHCAKLTELSFDGCPVTKDPYYRQVLLCSLTCLKVLDAKRVPEEDRRLAMAAQRKEEQRKQEMEELVKQQDARCRAISRAQAEWENAASGQLSRKSGLSLSLPQLPGTPVSRRSMRPRLLSTTARSLGQEEEDEDEHDDLWSLQCLEDSGLDAWHGRTTKTVSRLETCFSKNSSKKIPKKGKARLRRSGSSASVSVESRLAAEERDDLSHLVEMSGGVLEVYGTSAVVAVLKHSWPQGGAVHTIVFHYVVFDHVAQWTHKLKHIFPRAVNVSLQYTNLHSLCQLNTLAQFYDLETLTVSETGNSVTDLNLWRPYAIYRLPHTLHTVNNKLVTAAERVHAEEMFRGLSQEIATHLPKYRLSAFIRDSRIQQLFLKERVCAANALQKHAEGQVTSETIIKAFLTYNSHTESVSTFQAYAQGMCQEIFGHVEASSQKLWTLKRLLPTFLYQVVAEALEDFGDQNKYMKTALKRLASEKMPPK